jgi:hypothetical protein
MIRTLTLGGLLLAALAVSAAQKDKDEKPKDKDKEQPKAKVYKTPKDAFDAAVAAMSKKDYAIMVSCFTPEAHKQMAADLAMQGMFIRGKAEGGPAKDKEKGEPDEKAMKQYKPVFDVMDKHGLTKAATKDLKSKGFRASKEDREAILKLVKDHAAFAAAFMTAQDKASDAPERDDPKPTLTDVKVDGDKASGNVVVKFKVKAKDKDAEEVRERKQPVTFSKIKGGWLIDPEADEKDAPAPPDKDKGKKKD